MSKTWFVYFIQLSALNNIYFLHSPELIITIVNIIDLHCLDFSNFIGKPSIRAIAEADDHEVVREVQVNICRWFL